MEEKSDRSRKNRGLILILFLLTAVCAIFVLFRPDREELPAMQETTEPIQIATEAETEEETEPTETQVPATEPVGKVSTATIGATGDLLLHDRVIESGYDAETGEYHYEDIFQWFSLYVSQMDYAAANLEVTLAGNENGRKYSGYPSFNAPDAIVDAAKAAGFDMLLTANNHTYDTGYEGFVRTQQVIQDRELDYIGTREHVEDKNYLVQEINGIRVGMICYTYCTAMDSKGTVKLNGNALSAEAAGLVNYFYYKKLDAFYEKLGSEMEQMKAEGAEAIVLFIHWGTEYKTFPNALQKQMAQALCDLGIDVIVGNHAHVAQDVELLTSGTDENRKTLCIYSTGNSISNIRRSKSRPAHTEDGMLFQFTLAKYSDGTVLVESCEVLPTWVWRFNDESGVRRYRILTMEEGADWAAQMDLDEATAEECRRSFDRTMKIVGPGLETANAWFAERQAETEARLGIQ